MAWIRDWGMRERLVAFLVTAFPGGRIPLAGCFWLPTRFAPIWRDYGRFLAS